MHGVSNVCVEELIKAWSSQILNLDSGLQNVADSPTWRHVDETFVDFIVDTRNVRLILSTDGMNPLSFKTTTWSTWLVWMFIANFPPWAMTKKYSTHLVDIWSNCTIIRQV